MVEEAYLANYHPFVYPDQLIVDKQLAMKRTIASQMLRLVKVWVARYATWQFLTYDALKAPFLETFQRERINAHILIQLIGITQKGRSIHEYTIEFF